MDLSSLRCLQTLNNNLDIGAIHKSCLNLQNCKFDVVVSLNCYQQPYCLSILVKKTLKVKRTSSVSLSAFFLSIQHILNIAAPHKSPFLPLPPSSFPKKFFLLPSLKRNEVQKISSVYLIT